jgi:hypothetical protein
MEHPAFFSTLFAGVCPLSVQRAEKRGRSKKEVDEVIGWPIGDGPQALRRQIRKKNDPDDSGAVQMAGERPKSRSGRLGACRCVDPPEPFL